jgi:nucleotide-binding universal stress UspA family protein
MDATTNHILVPVDYSDKSVFGLQMAAKLLHLFGGKVTIINVVKGVDPIWSDFFTELERELWLKKLNSHLKQFAGRYIDASKFEMECLVIKGKLCETILKTADEIHASFIVMGTSTIDNIKKWIIGTNALRIVTEAKCPVITLKEAPSKDAIRKIILPMDFSKESREKVVKAVHWAKLFGAEIHVISAYSTNDDSIFTRLQNQQKQVVKFIEDHQVPFVAHLIKVNDTVDGILDYVAKNQGDIMVITTHQQLEIVNSFLGSFAKSMMRGANIPIISMVPTIKHNLIFKMPAT